MQTSGSARSWSALGLATLAPVLLRWTARRWLGRLLAGGAPATWRRTTPARRAHLLAGVLAPVIVLTSAAVGTLMLVGIDGRTLPGRRDDDTDDHQPAQQRGRRR